MIEITRISDASDPLFELLSPLYEEAFPPHERRTLARLGELTDGHADMYLYAIHSEGDLAGLVVLWQLGDFHYLEHLAVFESMRNRKIGQQILDWMSDNISGLRLLEVEPEGDQMTTRRIGFYKRNGYRILEKNYMQPSYEDGSDVCALWIMGSEETPHLDEYINRIKSIVYGF